MLRSTTLWIVRLARSRVGEVRPALHDAGKLGQDEAMAWVLEVGPGGMPCFLLSRQARRIAASLVTAADLVDGITAGTT